MGRRRLKCSDRVRAGYCGKPMAEMPNPVEDGGAGEGAVSEKVS